MMMPRTIAAAACRGAAGSAFSPLAAWLLLAVNGPAAVVTDWTFNQSSGTVAIDAGPNGVNGTLSGSTAWAAGFGQNAVSMHGDGFVDFTQSGTAKVPTVISSLAVGSIGVRFFVDAFPSDPTTQPILPLFWMGRDFGGSGQYGLTVEIGHGPPYTQTYNRHLYFTIMDGSAPVQCFNTTQTITAGSWYSFVGVVSATGNTGYLNGTEMLDRHYNFGDASTHYFFDSVTQPSTALWAGKGFLGDNTAAQHFNGLIQDLAIFDTPLSAGEVASLYSVSNTVPEIDAGRLPAVAAFTAAILSIIERRRRAPARGRRSSRDTPSDASPHPSSWGVRGPPPGSGAPWPGRAADRRSRAARRREPSRDGRVRRRGRGRRRGR